MKQKVNNFEPALGDRAFVYQQALELTQPVTIFMKCEKDIYNVTFILNVLNKKLKVSGEGNSFIEACFKAKKKAQRKISLIPSYHYEEKELLVDILKHNVFIH